jgi:translation initiation factor IF-2
MAKIRIYQLAKELGMTNEELLELLDQMGCPTSPTPPP